MSALETYTIAVAQRKAISRKMSGQSVNYAIVAQIEEKDIPVLLEIIRVQNEALEDLKEEGDGNGTARRAVIKVEELAASGSSARWGTHEGGDAA